jgi:Ni/Co efflux regulator RcnB
MKCRLLIMAVSLSLLLPTLSFAQPNPNGRPPDRPGGPGGNGPGDRPGRPDRPNPGGPGGNGPGNRPDRPNPGGPGMRPPSVRPGPGMRPPSRPPQFSWRGRSFSQMRGPAFRYPPGYAYRRWAIGAFLPSIFLGSSYYYDDWRGLGIDPPPPGRRWVRYGSDLLLVNLRTRRVEDTIYGAFY